MNKYLFVFFIMVTEAVAAEPNLVIDFSKDQSATDWYVVLDRVMGGASNGELAFTDQGAVFSGSVSLANNGGFASIRSPFGDYDLSIFSQVEIRYRLVGQGFALTLNNYKRFYLPRYKHALAETGTEWTTSVLKFSEFDKVRRGEVLEGRPSSGELREVIRLGLISNQKKAGEFKLEVNYLKFK